MKKHISKLLVCCLALGAILIPTASAAEGIYEDFTYVDFFFTGNTYDVSNPCIKCARGDASVEVTKFRNETDSDVVSYGVDYYTGRRATIEQRISGEVTYRNLDYLSGFGDTGEVYYLRAECSPEAGSNKDIQIKGTWIP